MKLDAFQRQAIQHINNGHSVIVSAPTGSGKTLIAEHIITSCLESGDKIIYTAPIKALSNQKFRDFHSGYGEKAGIMTGDVTINPAAPALIMTTEIFRNRILHDPDSLKAYSWIIFDEIHYLDDEERGTVWEESLIFLPPHMRLLGLSATIPNIQDLAEWIESIHQRKIKVVKSKERPVPLHFFYQCQGQVYDNLNELKRHGFQGLEPHAHKGGKIPKSIALRPNKLAPLIKHIATQELLPCIYFAFSRKRTEYLAEELLQQNFLAPDEEQRVLELFDQLCRQYDLTDESSAKKMRSFVRHGVAYHHAGMLPTLKESVERLFTSRLIKIIFTTETFALGINMPAKTVIFDELRKFYGRGFRPLMTRDFYQMAGRAGRRSIDTEGFVFSRINPHHLSFHELKNIIFREPERVNSRFNASYATLLNLYGHYGEKLYEVYPYSFHHFQVRKFDRKKALRILREKVNILKALGHIRKGQITTKGLFASKVFGYELLLAELYDLGTLETLSLHPLGILLLAVVFEPRKGLSHPTLENRFQHLERTSRKVIKKIGRLEHRARLRPVSKPCFFHLSKAMDAWLKGEDFERILNHTTVDEGEIIRYFRMTIQVARELLDTPVTETFKDTLCRLIQKINRDIIDAERQLRV